MVATTGTAMGVPVFEGEKKGRRFDSNLCGHNGYRWWAFQAVRRGVGRLNYDKAFLRVFRVFKHPK